MNEQFLRIDVSKLNDMKKYDLIKVQLENNEHVEVNFSKLVSQSTYIRDKYKYSDALSMMQKEIEEVKRSKKVSSESIKLFIELIQEEKANIPIKYFRDIYTLSEYFDTPIFINELDKLSEENLFKDLNFTIQNLQQLSTRDNEDETKLRNKIESFLSTQFNECIKYQQFSELPLTTICRILEKSDKEKIDHDLLVDFIVKSIDTRFIMLRFVKLEKLGDDKVDEFFDFIESQEEDRKEMYLEFLPFSLKFIKNMKNKYEKQSNKNEEKQEQIQNKQNLPAIIYAGGENFYNQLGENATGCINENRIISPPKKFQLYPSPILSFSIYFEHSVLIMNDGSLKVAGYNEGNRICSIIHETDIDHFTDLSIKDSNGQHLVAISAVCCSFGTLYLFSKNNDSGRYLVLCHRGINWSEPVFLDIGNHHPVSLFGGSSHSAAICSEGEVIFINSNLLQNSPNSEITVFSLPDGEKASSVACCEYSIVVLSLNGRVFKSPIAYQSNILKFSAVTELEGIEIVCISGVYEHFLAVSKEGRVFSLGSNYCGQLGLGKEICSVSTFTEISSLIGYKIKAAYAGNQHSLFQTEDGKILSCGYNIYGQLLLSSGPGENVYSPTETTITSNATFCIGGSSSSIVFIENDPPPNIPNKRIQKYK